MDGVRGMEIEGRSESEGWGEGGGVETLATSLPPCLPSPPLEINIMSVLVHPKVTERQEWRLGRQDALHPTPAPHLHPTLTPHLQHTTSHQHYSTPHLTTSSVSQLSYTPDSHS